MSKPQLFEIRGRHHEANRHRDETYQVYLVYGTRDQVAEAVSGTNARFGLFYPGVDEEPDDSRDYALPGDADALRNALLRETNVEFITRIMEEARTGPLMQAVVMTAIEQYVDGVITAGAQHFDSPMLSGKAWVACAEELQRELKARPS